MPEFQRKAVRAAHKGMQWDQPVDAIAEGQICFGKNIRVPQVDAVAQRPGLTNFADITTAPESQFIHSISKLNNTNTQLVNFASVYIAANNQHLFVGDTAAHLQDSSINPVPLPEPVKGNLSGNPLTMVDMAPVGTNTGWKYCGDYTRNFKIGYYPGDSTVPGTGNNMGKARVLTMGTSPPKLTSAFTITLDPGPLTGKYQWRFAFRHKFTGARSNVSAPTRDSAASHPTVLAAQRATFTTPFAPIDPLTGAMDHNFWVDIYRFGGSMDDWRWVGFTEGNTSYTDDIPDEKVTTAPTPPEVVDANGVIRYNLYRPFIIQDNARYSTVPGVVSYINGKWFLDTGSGEAATSLFDIDWLPGSVISIDNNDYTIHEVGSPFRLEVEQDLSGVLSTGNYAWATQTGTLKAGAPLSHIWGPYGIGSGGAYIFGCGGINCDAGTLYWTNGNDPDSTDITNSLLVTSPSEPLRGGCIYDGTPFCFSTERMFRIYPGSIPGQFTVQEVPGGKGIWAEYSLTVQSNGIADQSVSWVGKDGIYDWTASSGLQCLTDGTLYPFFPHGNQPGLDLTQIFPFLGSAAMSELHAVTAPSFASANMKYHRLCWFQGELFYDYPTTGGTFQTLVFDSRQAHGWVSVDQYAASSTSVAAFPVSRGMEIAANNMLVGIGANLATYTGTADFGITIPCRLITRSDDLGDSRVQKLYGDYWLDVTPGSGSVTIKPWLDNYTVDIGLTTISAGARQQLPINLSNGIGYLGRNWGMEFNWSAAATPAAFFQYSYSYVPKPELISQRATDKTDDGFPGAKYLRGLCIEANSAGVARTVRVLVDDITVATLTFNSSSQQELPFAITPTTGSEFQIQPTDTGTWELFSIRWTWEKWPDATLLQSNFLNMGTSKPKYVRGFSIPISAPNTPTLSFTATYDGPSTYTTTAINAAGITYKSPAQFSFNPPILAHQLKLTPSAPCRCWYDEIVWDAEEWPEMATLYGPQERLGNDSGAKYVRGFNLPIETGGASVIMTLMRDTQNPPNSGFTVSIDMPAVSTTPLSKNVFAFTPTSPCIGHIFQLRSNSPARYWYDQIQWEFEPWPEFDTGDSPWLDDGSPRAKFVRALIIPIDTGSQPVTFDLVLDNGNVIAMGPYTTTAGNKTSVEFAFSVPVIIHEFQLSPRTACRVWHQEIKWDLEPWPELLAESSAWLDGGTPGAKFIKGITMPVDTNSVPVMFDVYTDTGQVVPFGPFTTAAGAKTSIYCSFQVPLIIHQFRIQPRTQCRCWFPEIKWDADPWPEAETQSSSWGNAERPGAKFVQGVLLPLDTAGGAVTLDVLYDQTNDPSHSVAATLPIGPFTTPGGQKTTVGYSFPVPFIAHNLLITPRTTCRIWHEEVQWIWEPVPELVTTYTSQETSLDLPGYSYLFDAYIAYIGSADPPQLIIKSENATKTYNLPVSNGIFTRAYLLLDPQKAKWHSFSVTSTGGVRLFLKDCEVRGKNWTDKGNYPSAFQSHHPFGDESRVVGARI